MIPCSYWALACVAVLPSCVTSYLVSVRQARGLPVVSLFPHPASFRFHLAMDTLAFGYILPTTGRIRDFHPLETCAAGRTIKKRMGHEMPHPLFLSNVHERIRTSDLPLRSSPEFCLARYHRLSNIACFQAFWMVRIACSYHCYHLIPTSLMPSLLQPCCKARKFSRTSSVSISTI